MNILVAGGSGLIGQSLTRALADQGHTVTILSRSQDRVGVPAGVQVAQWDSKTAQGWGNLMNKVDAIINLTGANIGARPWTNERKRLIRSSRVDAGHAIVQAVQASEHKPRVALQISGISIYEDVGDQPVDESSPLADDFLASVGKDWEAAIQPVTEQGVRLAVLRSGVVLTPKGGVIEPFLLQNRLFAGGPLGSGKQWISWIHIHDLVRIFEFLLEREDGQGIFNACAPEPVTNATFGRTVSHVMHRPFWLPVPAFALKVILGEMSTTVLEGERALPVHLQEMGFRFTYDTLQKALEDVIRQAG